jgi:hypothetical protein
VVRLKSIWSAWNVNGPLEKRLVRLKPWSGCQTCQEHFCILSPTYFLETKRTKRTKRTSEIEATREGHEGHKMKLSHLALVRLTRLTRTVLLMLLRDGKIANPEVV